MGEFGGGESIGPPTFFVTDGQKHDYLSRAPCSVREVRLKKKYITYYSVIRGGPSNGHRYKNLAKFGRVVF